METSWQSAFARIDSPPHSRDTPHRREVRGGRAEGDTIRGVAIVGRRVTRMLDDARTLEGPRAGIGAREADGGARLEVRANPLVARRAAWIVVGRGKGQLA